MLLAIDIGNSNIVFGVFDDKTLKDSWRIETEKNKDEGFYQKLLSEKNLLDITGVVIGSVVPELDKTFSNISSVLFKTKPLFVSTELNTGIKDLSNKKTDLGADLLSDIVAAIHLYPKNCIVVDLGTASKFLAISNSEYMGGAIGPGIGSSFKSLISGASKLGDLKLEMPKKVVGALNTEEHLNSGFIYGFAGMVDGMVFRMKEELGWDNPEVILTGGFTDMITPSLQTKVTINKNLTLEGLRILWEQNH